MTWVYVEKFFAMCMDLERRVLRKKIEDSGGLEPDKRRKNGKHYSVGEDVKELVREHIRSFPARHSHYSCQDNAGKVTSLLSSQ